MSAGFWPPRFKNLGEISAAFCRRDFRISPRSRRDSRQDFGRRDLRISARSRGDLGENFVPAKQYSLKKEMDRDLGPGRDPAFY